MKQLPLVALALVATMVIGSLTAASPPPLAPSASGELYAPERILVRFKPGVDTATIAALHRAQGAVVIREIPQIGVQVLRVPANQVLAKVAAYSRNPNVLYAEPDYTAQVLGDPNDEYFPKQWGLDNDGQAYKDGQSGMVDADIDAPEAWDIITGTAEIRIAILDTGIDQDHPDLDDKLVGNVNFTDSDTVDDLYGHGTHVAGIAAAETNNTEGVAGVGYTSSLLNVKVLNDDGMGYYSWIADGIVWATDNGAKVINMSLGGKRKSSTLEDAVNYAWSKGVVLAAAAGNDGNPSPLYPAKYVNCIAVAATDSNDQKASFSQWGDWVDVAAPGVDIFSTFPNHPYKIGKSLSYDFGSGTSMSTPFVSGLAALVWATEYGTSNSAVRDQIEATCDAIPGTGEYWIHGRINACNAVGGSCSYEGAQPTPTPEPGGSMYVWAIDWAVKSYGPGGAFKDLKSTVTIRWDSDGDSAAESSDDPVSDASVKMTLTHDTDGDSVFECGTDDDCWNFSGTTDSNGQVTFTLKHAPAGSYQAEVTDVTHSTYTWDTSLDADNPDTYTLE